MALTRRRIELVFLGLYLRHGIHRHADDGGREIESTVIGMSMDAMAQILAR